MNVTLLWDVDGTLLTATVQEETLYKKALSVALNCDLDAIYAAQLPSPHGKTDRQIITEYVTGFTGRTREETREEITATQNVFEDMSGRVYGNDEACTVLPYVHDTLRTLAVTPGVENGLLTGNSENRSRLKLACAGIDATVFNWNTSFFGDAANIRSEMTVAAALHGEANATHPIIVGDTPNDGAAAREAGLPFIAVATGVYDYDDLLDDALYTLPNLMNFPYLLDTIILPRIQQSSKPPQT